MSRLLESALVSLVAAGLAIVALHLLVGVGGRLLGMIAAALGGV